MAEFKGIPVESGAKYLTDAGFTAIKNGVKRRNSVDEPVKGKPSWLRAKLPGGERFSQVKGTLRDHGLSTVCEESMCPNLGECWGNGTATIMVMGSVCTRACRFCAVDTGNPGGWLMPDEPANCARTVKLMGLRYVVITSVDRDDLPDGGATHYANCIAAVKRENPQTAVEALTPDFAGDLDAVETVVSSGLEVFAQNVETVQRLTRTVRDPRAGYAQSLTVLEHAKSHRPEVLTKTSLMVGLGETEQEIYQAMDDIRGAGVDILTLGQYLQPTRNHLPVHRYVHPDEFNRYREVGLTKGFLEVVSGPMVRSSYRAERVLEGTNVGLTA